MIIMYYHLFTRNVSNKEFRMNYSQLAENFANTHTVNPHIFFEVISHFSPKSNINVLDFGCGNGNYIKAMRKYTNYHIYGVEPCEEMIKLAKIQNPNVIIKSGNHLSIPFPDNFFEYVYMTNVVHQVPDISAMYNEIYRILKPNGVLCICTESRRQLLSKYWIRYFPSIIIEDLKRFPSISKLKRIAKKQLFRTIKVTFVGEKKWSHISKFLLEQVTKCSMSVLNLISTDEYKNGKEKMLKAYKKRKVHFSNRGYTFLWLRKCKK